jgi:hypothetical protein
VSARLTLLPIPTKSWRTSTRRERSGDQARASGATYQRLPC